MECGCSIDADYDNGPVAFSDIMRTARKQHRCCECHRTIMPGDQYRHESGIWESGPRTYKTCADCASVRDVYFCAYIYGEMWEMLRVKMVDDGLDTLIDGRVNKLTPKARDAMFGMVQGVWDEEDEENPNRCAWRLLFKTSDANPHGMLPWHRPDWMQRRMREAFTLGVLCWEEAFVHPSEDHDTAHFGRTKDGRLLDGVEHNALPGDESRPDTCPECGGRRDLDQCDCAGAQA